MHIRLWLTRLVDIVWTDTNNAESSLTNWSLLVRAGQGFMARLGDAAPSEMVDLYLGILKKDVSPFDVQATNEQTPQPSGYAERGTSMHQERKTIWSVFLHRVVGTRPPICIIYTRRCMWHCCEWG